MTGSYLTVQDHQHPGPTLDPAVVLFARTWRAAHLVPDFQFPFSWPSMEREVAGVQRNCWMNCWTEEEAVLRAHSSEPSVKGFAWGNCAKVKDSALRN